MKPKQTKIVILAAGIGSRLRPLTNKIPKCLIEVNNVSLIKRIVNQIQSFNKDLVPIIIGGYKFEVLSEHLKNLEVRLIENKDYLSTNNMYSLHLAINEMVDNDILIINGDCIYEDEIVYKMLETDDSRIAIIKTEFNEEAMKVRVNNQGIISEMSKSLMKQNDVFVSMDMYRLSKKDIMLLKEVIKTYIDKNEKNLWTEFAINDILFKTEIAPLDFSDKKWFEIDTLEDLEKAEIKFTDEV